MWEIFHASVSHKVLYYPLLPGHTCQENSQQPFFWRYHSGFQLPFPHRPRSAFQSPCSQGQRLAGAGPLPTPLLLNPSSIFSLAIRNVICSTIQRNRDRLFNRFILLPSEASFQNWPPRAPTAPAGWPSWNSGVQQPAWFFWPCKRGANRAADHKAAGSSCDSLRTAHRAWSARIYRGLQDADASGSQRSSSGAGQGKRLFKLYLEKESRKSAQFTFFRHCIFQKGSFCNLAAGKFTKK